MPYHTLARFFTIVLAASLIACPNRPTKPLVLTEQVGELPVQFASQDCQIPVLKAAPSEPYEVIARVKTYGDPGTD
jgi:hypothetical protein